MANHDLTLDLHDLPLLIMPMHLMLDQRMTGQSVQAHGAARLLSKTGPAERSWEAVVNLLESGPHEVAAAATEAGCGQAAAQSSGQYRLEPVLADG